MMKQKLFIFLIFLCLIATTTYGQKKRKSFFTPTKYGVQFSQGNENNFLFDDPDYFYRTNTIKGEVYFSIATLKTVHFSLVIKPQLQFIQHQLYNEQFVRPEENNYQEKRKRFTRLKDLTLTAIEFSFEAKQPLFKPLSIFLQVGLGFSYIDTETERLAKGFTFIENGIFGLDVKLNSKIALQIFSGIGHVSNLDFQLPNSGYNIYNNGFGFQYILK